MTLRSVAFSWALIAGVESIQIDPHHDGPAKEGDLHDHSMQLSVDADGEVHTYMPSELMDMEEEIDKMEKTHHHHRLPKSEVEVSSHGDVLLPHAMTKHKTTDKHH